MSNRPPVAPPEVTPIPTPRDDQPAILYSSIVFLFVVAVFWSLPIIRVVINPLKLYTIGWHELCHIVVAIITGGSVLSISIDPNLGGACEIEGGSPSAILFAGYTGSILWGGTLVLGAWNLLVAKILSICIALGLLLPLSLVRDKLTILMTFIYEGLLIGFWFIDHGSPLRWYCLFLGIMHIFYIVWDVSDERFMKKANTSDITQYTLIFTKTGIPFWIIFWFILAAGALVGFSLLGQTVWKLNSDQMYAQAARFLPT